DNTRRACAARFRLIREPEVSQPQYLFGLWCAGEPTTQSRSQLRGRCLQRDRRLHAGIHVADGPDFLSAPCEYRPALGRMDAQTTGEEISNPARWLSGRFGTGAQGWL